MKTIRQVAERYGLTHRTLRFFEQKGLIAPERANGHRLYSAAEEQRLALVLRLRAAGLPLDLIAVSLAPGRDRVEVARDDLLAVRTQLVAEAEAVGAKLKHLNDFLDQKRTGPLVLVAGDPESRRRAA